MDTAALVKLALEHGFEYAAPLDVETLRFLPEVRAMCSADRCHSYNKTWSCPPAVEDLDILAARCAGYRRGVLVQTVGHREDEFDYESIQAAGELHHRRFDAATKALKPLFPRLWPMGMGSCTRCKTCTWPEAPCRFPEEVFPSMEACGLMVNEVCVANGLNYYYGPDAISFTSCWLME